MRAKQSIQNIAILAWRRGEGTGDDEKGRPKSKPSTPKRKASKRDSQNTKKELLDSGAL
jgi:hypothetical protein